MTDIPAPPPGYIIDPADPSGMRAIPIPPPPPGYVRDPQNPLRAIPAPSGASSPAGQTNVAPDAEAPGWWARIGHGAESVVDAARQLGGMAGVALRTGDPERLAERQANLDAITGDINANEETYQRGLQAGKARGDYGSGKNPIADALIRGAQIMAPGQGADALTDAGNTTADVTGQGDFPSTLGQAGMLSPLGLVKAPATVGMRILSGIGQGAGAGVLSEPSPTESWLDYARHGAWGALFGGGLAAGTEAAAAGASRIPEVGKWVGQKAGQLTDWIRGSPETAPAANAVADAVRAPPAANGIVDPTGVATGGAWNVPGTVQPQTTATVHRAMQRGEAVDPAAVSRQADFEALNAPFSRANITRDPNEWYFEQETSKLRSPGQSMDLYPDLTRIQQGQDQAFSKALGDMSTDLNGGKLPGAFDKVQAASNAATALRKSSQQEVSGLYAAAENAGGNRVEVPLAGLANDYGKAVQTFGAERIPPSIRKQMNALGINDEIGAGLAPGLTQAKSLDIDAAFKLRSDINANMPNPAIDKPGYAALATVRDSLDDAIDGTLQTASQGAGRLTSFKQIAPGESLGPFIAGSDVRNMSSIPASLEAGYKIEPGIQAVPLSEFYGGKGPTPSYSATEQARTDALAQQIGQSGRMDPLIVVKDREGYYVLEGGHRLDASYQLGATHVPAIVVRDAEVAAPSTPAAVAGYRTAIDAARQRFGMIRSPLFKDLSDAGGNVSPEWIEKRLMTANPQDIASLRDAFTKPDVLGRPNPGMAAWDALKSGVIDELHSRALPIAQGGRFSGYQFGVGMSKLDQSRLASIFNADELQRLGQVQRASYNAKVQPAYANTNTSNTASTQYNMQNFVPKQLGVAGTVLEHVPLVGEATAGLAESGGRAYQRALQAALVGRAVAPGTGGITAGVNTLPMIRRQAIAQGLIRGVGMATPTAEDQFSQRTR